jgi:4-alpha-glucanotransferase
VAPETLVRVCAAMGAPVTRPADAAAALRAYRTTDKTESVPPVLVAWDGVLPARAISRYAPQAEIHLEDGSRAPLDRPLPFGYHRLATSTVIAAPVQAWRRPGAETVRSWGIGTHLAALRSERSRSVGDLRDLESVCRWVSDRGGDLVMVLPLLATFNAPPAEPSPYSPVSRLFWSELMLDLEGAHRPAAPPATLDVTRADAEVRMALAGCPAPDPSRLDEELRRYARFRGAQARLGRNWRDWPAAARDGTLRPDDVNADEERFHLVAQTLVREQLTGLRQHLDPAGMRLGLDLAVGVHPDGYDPWSRPSLFATGMSVGAPPDQGFPSGQDWGFPPVLPEASRREGHRYLAASIGLQAELAGVVRVDHIMAWTRLYWIPHGFGLHEGTYVSYPAEELFAVLALESHRHRCEVVGENLGNVPREIDTALPRHRIWGMYLAQFAAASSSHPVAPTAADMALVGTHDTPTFAGWLAGTDIAERVRYRLLDDAAEPLTRTKRAQAARRLAKLVGGGSRITETSPRIFLAELLEWLGRSASPLVVPWLEDFWLEDQGVNLPGTRSQDRPNWRRPMRRLLEAVFADPEVNDLVDRLDRARTLTPGVSPP